MLLKNWIFPFTGAFALLLFFFLGTLESVPGGDSAMFIGAAFSSGVAQPPGYPLVTLIYKLLFIFPGDSTHLINFSSAIFNTMASIILYRLFHKILGCRWSSIVFASFFCVLPIVFRYSLVAEVFALNNILCASILYLTYSYVNSKEIKTLYLGSFICGLGISNHHSFVLVAIPCILYLLLKNKELLKPIIVLNFFLFTLIGLLPYLYLIWAPSTDALISWGDTSSFEGFFHHFLRKDFGTFKLTASGKGGLGPNLFEFFKDLTADSYALFLILPIYWLFRKIKLKNTRRFDFEYLILSILSFYIIFFFSLSNIDLSNPLFKEVFARFWQVPLLLLLIISCFGIRAINERFPNYKKSVFAILLILFMTRAFFSFQESSRRGNSIIEDYGKIMLTSLPNSAVLFATGDLQVNILRYLQVVKKLRTDITVLPIPLMDLKWYRGIHKKMKTDIKLPDGLYSIMKKPGSYQLIDIAKLNPQKKYFILHDAGMVKKSGDSDLSLLKRFKWVPYGFLFSLVPLQNENLTKEVIRNHNWAKGQFKPENYKIMESGSWEELVQEIIYWNAERFHMIYHTREIKRLNDYKIKIMLANHIEGLRAKHNKIPPEFLKNLGLLYYQLVGKLPNAVGKMILAWGEYYKNLSDKNSKEASEIKKALDHFSRKNK